MGGAARERIEHWFAAALAAVDPRAAVARTLAPVAGGFTVEGDLVAVGGRLVVVAIGKAAPAMARGVIDALPGLATAGWVLTKEGHAGDPIPGFVVREAGHPIPDERGVTATREILAGIGELAPKDVVLFLISGGGSALLEAPRDPLTLDDFAEVTRLLLRAGAPIHDLNAIRIPLSRVKGGRLRAATPAARTVTLIVSDVLGNDPHLIASGPTVPGAATGHAALALLRMYGVIDQVPAAVVPLLQGTELASRAGADDLVRVVASNETAVEAVRLAAAAEGETVSVTWHDAQGEAAELGVRWVNACRTANPGITVLVGGGESTVTVTGDGVGGRNTEFALAAALALDAGAATGWTVASLATDGQDALTGVAGAVVAAGTCEAIRLAGFDPLAALQRNDSLPPLDAVGATVVTGPTGTNVADLYLAVRD